MSEIDMVKIIMIFIAIIISFFCSQGENSKTIIKNKSMHSFINNCCV